MEQIKYTYDTRILKDLCDKHLARFAVPEQTGDNVHYFLFKKDNKGNAVLQYKMKRYSFAMWPRKYHEGQSYEHAEYGFGTVCRCEPFKDPISKQKYWKNTVQFTREDGSGYETVFKTNAVKHVILVFPSCANGELTIPFDFPLASFDGTFSETLGDQKAGVQSMIDKLKLSAELPQRNQCPCQLNLPFQTAENTTIRTQRSYSQPQKIHFCY